MDSDSVKLEQLRRKMMRAFKMLEEVQVEYEKFNSSCTNRIVQRNINSALNCSYGINLIRGLMSKVLFDNAFLRVPLDEQH